MSTYAVITGASAGLGREFATLFAQANINVILVARREERLLQIADELRRDFQVQVEILPLDLSRAGAPEKLREFVEERKIAVDYLVNNAGFGLLGKFDVLSTAKQLEMIDLNMRALTELSHLFLPQMKKRGTGRILNIGSTAGFQPGPNMSVYYATKAYVNSFSEALSAELEGTGVTVTLSCPGTTSTEFGDVAGARDSVLFSIVNMKARDVAEEAFRAMMKGERRVIHGLHNRILAALAGFTPNWLNLKIVAKLNSKVTSQ